MVRAVASDDNKEVGLHFAQMVRRCDLLRMFLRNFLMLGSSVS